MKNNFKINLLIYKLVRCKKYRFKDKRESKIRRIYREFI